MKLSLIIAMFNIENYIAECLNSCICQKDVSIDDYEIIIVNDGSTDHSREIANTYLNKSYNVHLIDRINGGLSAARNTGLLNAKGEYVWFIDGDDRISEYSVSILIDRINKYHCDVYMIDYSAFYEDNTSKSFSLNLPKGVFVGKSFMESKMRILPMMAWLSIYRRSYLIKEKLCFTEGIIHEDLDFSVRSHYLANSILYIAIDLYKYRVNSAGSIMAKVKKDYTKSVISYSVIQIIWSNFFKNINIANSYRNYLLGLISQFITTRLFSGKIDDNCQEIKQIKSKRKIYIKFLWNSGAIKSKLFVLFILFTPKKLCEHFCSKKLH